LRECDYATVARQIEAKCGGRHRLAQLRAAMELAMRRRPNEYLLRLGSTADGPKLLLSLAVLGVAMIEGLLDQANPPAQEHDLGGEG
jgi:hypothetical protein